MKVIVSLLVLTAVVAVYVVLLRPWLRKREWAQGYFRVVEPVELWLYGKSETILWSRFLVLLGMIPGFLSAFAGFDFSPFIEWVPEKYRPWLFLAVTIAGVMGEALRRDTTKPLAVISLPEEKTSEQAAVVANVEAANKLAVSVANDCPQPDRVRAAEKSDHASAVARVEVRAQGVS